MVVFRGYEQKKPVTSMLKLEKEDEQHRKFAAAFSECGAVAL